MCRHSHSRACEVHNLFIFRTKRVLTTGARHREHCKTHVDNCAEVFNFFFFNSEKTINTLDTSQQMINPPKRLGLYKDARLRA